MIALLALNLLAACVLCPALAYVPLYPVALVVDVYRRTHWESAPRPYGCAECDLTFVDPRAFGWHLYSHDDANVRAWTMGRARMGVPGGAA